MSSFYMPCFLISFYCRKYVTPAKIYCFLRCSEICTYWRTQRQGRSMNVRTKSYLYQELCIHILLIKYLYIPQIIYLLSPSYRQGRAEEFFWGGRTVPFPRVGNFFIFEPLDAFSDHFLVVFQTL